MSHRCNGCGDCDECHNMNCVESIVCDICDEEIWDDTYIKLDDEDYHKECFLNAHEVTL